MAEHSNTIILINIIIYFHFTSKYNITLHNIISYHMLWYNVTLGFYLIAIQYQKISLFTLNAHIDIHRDRDRDINIHTCMHDHLLTSAFAPTKTPLPTRILTISISSRYPANKRGVQPLSYECNSQIKYIVTQDSQLHYVSSHLISFHMIRDRQHPVLYYDMFQSTFTFISHQLDCSHIGCIQRSYRCC